MWHALTRCHVLALCQGAGQVNESTFEWAVANLPLFASSDSDLNAAYYYRAKSYKSHLMRTDWADIKHVSSEFGSVPLLRCIHSIAHPTKSF